VLVPAQQQVAVVQQQAVVSQAVTVRSRMRLRCL
jgi:hypothetical protein